MKKIFLIFILTASLGTQAVSNNPLTEADLNKVANDLKTALKSLGITITDSQIEQKMQEISKQISQQDLQRLNQPIQNTPLSQADIQEIQNNMKKALKNYGVSQEDIHQLTQQIQSFNP